MPLHQAVAEVPRLRFSNFEELDHFIAGLCKAELAD